MEPSDSDVVFLEEVNSTKGKDTAYSHNVNFIQANGDITKGDMISPCNGDDINEDVPDFDDLEVLDAWEEVEESNEETEQNEASKEKLDELVPNTSLTKVHKKESETPNATKSTKCDKGTKNLETDKSTVVDCLKNLEKNTSKKSEETSKNLKADKDSVENSTTLENTKTASKNNLKVKKDDHEKGSNRKVNDSLKNVQNKSSGDTSNRKKGEEKVDHSKNIPKESKKNNSPTLTVNTRHSNSNEPEKSSRRSHESSKGKQAFSKISNEKDLCRADLHLPKDATETKVDRFLKEMALQNPHIISLKDTQLDEKSLEPISSDSSKHSSIVSPPGLDPSDLPPGVDMDQLSQDTGTSLLLSAIRQSETLPSWGTQDPSHKLGREHGDSSKGAADKDGRSRSPYSKNQDQSHTFRNSGSPLRRKSSQESFSLSPSPTPRSRRLSPSSVQYSRVPSNYNYMASNVAPGYSERPNYSIPAPERNRFHRSPVRDPMRELSRSLSRERLRHRSRSRSWSRGRTYARRRSPSRHRYSSKEEHYRRYHKSSSHSRSPTRRMRSRSRSQSRHQFSNKRSPVWDDEQRSKRPRTSRSVSRSQSPWRSHAETSSNEWHMNYPIRKPLLDEEVKLEHDMARFIATNIAATGLRPPVSNVTGWFDAGVKPPDIPGNIQAIPEPPPVIVDHGMPLPPPPPDISELMTPEEIKETKSQREMSPVPAVSLSSLLESAVTGFPEKVIMDRCQDAIMKLHDVSIKPGRFAVISTIKVPQAEPSSTFQPWQSVLNRSLASKIHFTFSKLPDQPVYWKPKSIPMRTSSSSVKDVLPGSSSQSRSIPVSSTVDMDRSALLERIFLLTRELQEVRRILDSRTPSKNHIAVQTSFMNYCDSCGIETDSRLRPPIGSGSSVISGFQSSSLMLEPTRQHGSSWQPVPQPVPAPQSVRQPQPVPAPQSVRQPQPVPAPQSVRQPQPVPAPQSVRQRHPQPVPVPAPQSVRQPQPVPTPQPLRLPQPVPPPQNARRHPAPHLVQPPNPVPATNLKQTTSQTSGSLVSNPPSSSSILGPPPIAGPSQTINWCLANQPGPSSAVVGASTSQTHVSLNASGQQPGSNQSAKQEKGIPSLMSIVPGAASKKTVKNKTVPAQKTAPLLPIPNQAMAPSMASADYDVSKYQMVGDEHMVDLISYLRSVGKQINFDPKFVSFGLNIDQLLKCVIGAGSTLHRQVILFFGMYDANYSAKTLCKFKQLIGYLKKRCDHLVVIEPPPIPKHGTSCKVAWNSFNSLEQDFLAFKSENVSLVKIMSFLLLNPSTPNNAHFADPLRLGLGGLKLIAEELESVIFAARKKKHWLS